MMKKVLMLSAVLLILEAVRLQRKNKQNQVDPLSQLILGNCTAKQSRLIKDAIDICETQDQKSTASCVNSYIKNNSTNKQEWNSVIFPNNETDIGLQFWYFNDCYVKIIDNQTFNRTYILWPDKLFLNSTQTVDTQGQQILQQQKARNKYQNLFKQNLKADNCSTWRKSIVNATLQYCDVNSNQIAASCISRRLKDLASDYWNVFVTTSNNAIAYPWFYKTCDLSFTNFGTYQRTIEVWKAYYD